MAWDHFHETHYRPYLVVAQFSTERARAIFCDLATELVMVGSYAISPPGEAVQASFESESDSVRFAAPFQALAVTREDTWATRTIVALSDEAMARLSKEPEYPGRTARSIRSAKNRQ
jgi:hypothetical protein